MNNLSSKPLPVKNLSPPEKEWAKALACDNNSLVLSALHQIRNAGSVRMLPYILRLLKENHESRVHEAIYRLIGEIKTQEAVPCIMDSLSGTDTSGMKELLAACWQSSLDFSAHLRVFTGIFIRGDYTTALEAFTVIEQSMPNTDEKARLRGIQELKDAESLIPAEKIPLWKELISLLRQV